MTIMKNKKIKKPGWEYLKSRLGISQVGISWVGIFREERFTSGEFDWWVLSGCKFSW